MTAAPALAGRLPALSVQDDLLVDLIAEQAHRALLNELATWPKPGLVSYVDAGSHDDMDAAMLCRSAEALRPFFADLALAGRHGAGMSRLREIGIRAEAAMRLGTGGVNTHRGAIFGLGLLSAAAATIARLSNDGDVCAPGRLGDIVAQRWGQEIRRGPFPLHSHGSAALRQHGAGGARAEAAAGFPSIYEIGLPALRLGRLLAPDDLAAPPVQACFALIAAVRDTNLLHRGGAEGARYAAGAAAAFLSAGGVGASDWRARAALAHAGFVARRLSPGGSADLLAMTLFVDALETGAVPR
jgi:triphosphoribosyl-dephospho-CoA synthase